MQHQITHVTLRDLMKLINSDIAKMLPEDPRTLLETPQEVIITKIDDDGQYWHHGFEKSLQCIFRNISKSKTISVNINMDGLPILIVPKLNFGLFCSTLPKCQNCQPWSLVYIVEQPNVVICNRFSFVDEMKEVMTNGIRINSHKITVNLRCFVCDSPARAYVKGVANFNAHHGCQKYTTIGEYSYVSNTNIFLRTE